MVDMLSPKQVSRAIGVSESTLKRWCDRGLIKTIKTEGGHRKLPVSDVLRFVRERNHDISFEGFGLPTLSQSAPAKTANEHPVAANPGAVRPGSVPPETVVDQTAVGMNQSVKMVTEALLKGDGDQAWQLVCDLHNAKLSISAICDKVLSPAFAQLGRYWEDHSADIYQERRSCEVAQRILFELRHMVPPIDPYWTAIGGTLTGDNYSLPTKMTELVLRDAGWNANSLGTAIPFDSMVRAILDTRPKLFWLTASLKIEDLDQFASDFKKLSDAAESVGAALVIGGQAFNEEIRSKLTYCCHCDSMQQLHSFAKAIRRIWTPTTPGEFAS
jgi:MerR family transcriptional regulator, light-induced transcriptional regulator